MVASAKLRRSPPEQALSAVVYDERHHVPAVRVLGRLGATDQQIAEAFGISPETLVQWKLLHKDFADAYEHGCNVFTLGVERNLAQRARGYDYIREKPMVCDGKVVIAEYLEHVPADVAAGIFWLVNRRPNEWKPIARIARRLKRLNRQGHFRKR